MTAVSLVATGAALGVVALAAAVSPAAAVSLAVSSELEHAASAKSVSAVIVVVTLMNPPGFWCSFRLGRVASSHQYVPSAGQSERIRVAGVAEILRHTGA